MLWKGELFAAQVLEIHASSKVDVQYEIDGNVEAFLCGRTQLARQEKKKKLVAGRGGRGSSCAWRMAVPTKSTGEGSAVTMVKNHAPWKAAPPMHIHEACAASAAQEASEERAIALPMQGRKADIAQSMVVNMDSAAV